MPAFKLNAVFYMNQMYSAISNRDRKAVIDRCYWPLLELIETNVPINIQVSGLSLEIVDSLDRAWIERLRQCLTRNRCELIGNGYSQIIAPLVPAKVNHFNQILGHQVYQSLLHVEPTIATTNEMAYSPGIVEHFLDAGYRALYVEWNNPRHCHPDWDPAWRYYRQEALGAPGKKIPIVWVDSMVSQTFQRHVHAELEFDEYLQLLSDHASKAPDGYLCLYASDTEVFDYRPGRFSSESAISADGEWRTIRRLFEHIQNDDRFELTLASDILAMPPSEHSDNTLRLESPKQPIPVKKQEKYNLYRWALTGRADLEINTKCYRIYRQLAASQDQDHENWRRLCYLWSSDFRTHIEMGRWQEFKNYLDECADRTPSVHTKARLCSDHDGTERWRQDGRFGVREDKRYLTVESESMACVFDKYKGLAVRSLSFPHKADGPLFGTLPHGYFDDISLGADFFTGHTIIEQPGEHKITDLARCTPRIFSRDDETLTLAVQTMERGITFSKEYTLVPGEPALEIEITIALPCRDIATIHLGNFTLIPLTYEPDGLFFATHNGGEQLERHQIKDDPIHHAESISPLVSARYGLGATKGFVILGDSKRSINVFHDHSYSALIPSIHYRPVGGGLFFLRLQYSAQETDETFRKDPTPQTIACTYRVT